MEDAGLRHSLLTNIALLVVLLLLLVLVFVFQIGRLMQLSRATSQSFAIIQTATELQKNILSMENGMRGYRLTRQPYFLQPYTDAKDIHPLLRERVRIATADFPNQQLQVQKINAELDGWIQKQDKNLDRLRSQGLHERLGYIVESETSGQNQIKSVHKSITQLIENEDKTLHQTIKQRNREAEFTVLYGVIAAVGVLVIFSYSIWKQMSTVFGFYNRNYCQLLRTQSELAALNEDLEQKVFERTVHLKAVNEELEAFSYSVSHDLRAPLRGIDGFSQALVEDYSDRLDAKGLSYLQFVREGVQRMGQLIDDLLRLSRINRIESHFEDFDIAETVKAVLSQAQQNPHFKRVRFSYHGCDGAIAHADPGLIRIVLENLVENALKYSAKKEQPEVEIGILPLASSAKSDLVFYVRDNGVGFDMQYSSKLFGAFQRLHSSTEFSGSGVGLATVKRIVSRHGGRVWAESKTNEGATFFVQIKRALPPELYA